MRIVSRIKNFRQGVLDFQTKVRNLSKFKKLIILFLVVAVPAGIALASVLLVAWNRKRKR